MKQITIIGGGLGGLTSGALLAKKGYSVTLLEQHTIVGGCATTFQRKGGFTCEVGLHKMDGVYSDPLIKRIFNELEVYDSMEFITSENFYTISTKTRSYTLPYGIDNATEYLTEIFPEEKLGITNYFKLISDIGNEIEILQDPLWYHYALLPFLFWKTLYYMHTSVMDVLEKLIKNEELKLILNANVQYYNDHPDTLSFILHAKAQSSYYNGKGWFIKGGSSILSEHLASIIVKYGGEVITSASVTACTHNSIKYSYKEHIHTKHTDIIISNLSPEDTYRLFQYPHKEKKSISNGLTTIYFGFSKNLKKVYGTREYTSFFMDNITNLSQYKEALKTSILKRGFGFTDYSQIDSGLTKDPGKSFAVTCTTDYIDEWKDLDAITYKEKKHALIENTLKQLEQHYPGISKLVEYAEVGTVKTQQRYLKTPNGTAYGYKPTPKSFFHIPRSQSSKIANLYFVGQWIIAGGFSPAIISGGICVKEINKQL